MVLSKSSEHVFSVGRAVPSRPCRVGISVTGNLPPPVVHQLSWLELLVCIVDGLLAL